MAVDQAALDRLEHDLEAVRTAYDRYFSGIGRTPRMVLEGDLQILEDHAGLKKHIFRLKTQHIVNTAVRFRLTALTARFNTFDRFWKRTMREIEEGRSTRDRFRARLDAAHQAPPASAASRPRQDHSMSPDALAALHKQYVMARLECNQPVDNISREQLAQSIQKSLPELRKQYKDKEFEFKVIVEGGKAKLKAVAKA